MKPIRRPLRFALIAVAAIGVLGVGAGAGAVLIARFDPNPYKPRIVDAVKHATGRDLVLNGKIGMKPSLWPTLQVEDVAFSNPPDFSRPQMATLQRLELQLALLPLLAGRIEIDRLVLIHPDILLETDAAGHSNWRMTREVSPSVPDGSPAPAGSQALGKSGKARTTFSIDTIRIQDGTLAYRDAVTGKVTMLGLPKLEASSSSPDSPLHVDADFGYNGIALNLVADTGSLTRLQDPAATSPWPVKLALTAAGATLAAEGSLTQPLQGKGYDLAVNGTVPDASTLTPLLRGFVPSPLHDVGFAARIAGDTGKPPAFSSLTLHVGASDLGAEIQGLTLDKLDIDAPKADQPMKVDAAGKLKDVKLTVAGTFGRPALLMPGVEPVPFPVDATVQAAGATISAKGSIADAHAMTGANIALAAQIPDLSALSPLARALLPALKTVAFQGTLTDVSGGFQRGAALHDVSLTSPDGDLSGDAAIGLGDRVSLTAALKSSRIDLDALQAVIDPMPAAASPSSAKPAPPKRVASKRGGQRLFSEQPIPFDLLRTVDADLKLDIAALHTGGVDYKAIAGHAVLKDGKLSVDPYAVDLPGGHLSGTLSTDAAQAAPPVHITMRTKGVALQTILAATHQPAYASGNLEVYADLHGSGDSPHAIASSLDGSLGLAMAGGSIDNRLLSGFLGEAMDLVGKGGSSELKCFGMRIDARDGIGTIEALALRSSLLTMTGGGTVNLGEETLALRLRPEARVGSTRVVIPVTVSGPIRDPAAKVNKLEASGSNGGATLLGIVGGLLGGDKRPGSGTVDNCTPALAAARGQEGAPAAKPAASVGSNPGGSSPGGSKPRGSNLGAFLKNLFR